MSSESSIDFVLKTVEERDIRFVRLWFTDVLGHLKSFSISPEELEEAFTEGIGFDGSAVDGFARLEESDMLAFPDANTFQLMPRKEGEHSAVARVFCDIRTPSRDPFDGDPRGVLERVFTQADEQGLVFNVGPKIEYFYFDNDLDPVPLDHCGYFDFSPTDSSLDLRRAISRECEKNGIPVQYSHHGNAESQNAIELRYNEAVSCADNIMATRLIIREQAAKRGFFASFMPKPLADYPGSAMFLYLSMFDHDGENLFWAPKESNDAHLSELAQHFVAGLLAYAPEYMLVTNPTVNSYKRFTSDGVVPLYATWGRKDRSALVRIPTPICRSPSCSPPVSRVSRRSSRCPPRLRLRPVRSPPTSSRHAASSACPARSARRSSASRPARSCARRSATTSSTSWWMRRRASGRSSAPPSPTGSAAVTTTCKRHSA